MKEEEIIKYDIMNKSCFMGYEYKPCRYCSAVCLEGKTGDFSNVDNGERIMTVTWYLR